MNCAYPLIILIGICSLISLSGASSANESINNSLAEAISVYEQAQASTEREARLAGFKRAYQLFDYALTQIEQSGATANAALYLNQGTAALQAEQLGAAILAFRRALVHDPDNIQALQNLNHARGLLPAWLPRSSEDVFASFFFWRHSWSAQEQLLVATVCFLLATLSFAAAIYWRSDILRNLAWLPALLWLVLLGSWLFAKLSPDAPAAVIMVAETAARAADSINAPLRFGQPLPEGSEVTVAEWRQDWAKITLANDQDAWVNRSSLVLVDNN